MLVIGLLVVEFEFSSLWLILRISIVMVSMLKLRMAPNVGELSSIRLRFEITLIWVISIIVLAIEGVVRLIPVGVSLGGLSFWLRLEVSAPLELSVGWIFVRSLTLMNRCSWLLIALSMLVLVTPGGSYLLLLAVGIKVVGVSTHW